MSKKAVPAPKPVTTKVSVAAPVTTGQTPTRRKPRVVRTDVQLATSKVAIYAGTKVARALEEVKGDMTLYKGVRLAELMEAVYQQGRKDGARSAREALERVWDSIPYRNPGKPAKK